MTDQDGAGPGRSGEAADPDPDELITAWGLFTEAAVAVSARLSDGLAAAGHLSLAEFDVLIRLYREPTRRLPMARIAGEVGLTASGFTKFADRLEQDQMITRERSTDDRRIIYAVLTEHGTALTAVALTHHVNDLRLHLLEPLGTQGFRELPELSRKLRDHTR